MRFVPHFLTWLRNLKQNLNFKGFKFKHGALISAASTEQQSPHTSGNIHHSKVTKGLKLLLFSVVTAQKAAKLANTCLEGQQEKQFPMSVVSAQCC